MKNPLRPSRPRSVSPAFAGLFLLAVAAGALTPVAVSAAESSGTGLGAVFGEPTGLTAKFWRDGHTAFDAGLSYSFSDYFLVYGDWLWHFPGAFHAKEKFLNELTPYVGAGAELVFSTRTGARDRFSGSGSSAGLAARIPLGLEWRPNDPPLGVFLELVPVLGLVPSMTGWLQGGIGIRYYLR